MLETDPADQATQGDADANEDSGSAIGSGLIEKEGFLPLPEDAADDVIEPTGDRQPVDEQEFESLPPALGGARIHEDTSEVEYAEEASGNGNISATSDRAVVDQRAWGQQPSDGKVAVDFDDNVEPEITVIENGAIDDAAEAFDLGELFE